MTRVAVVGHVEWVDVARIARLPRPGEIVHARELRTRAGGGGAMAAFALASLAGACDLLTALGDDDAGDAALADLLARGVAVHAARRSGTPQRRAITLVDDDHERTIVVARERLVPHGADALPWDRAAGWDAVYVTGGDAGAIRAARAARIVVATPRARDALVEAGVALDVVVASSGDAGEAVDAPLRALAGAVVLTEGAAGGRIERAGRPEARWDPVPLPGVPVDAYGCGDTFAAGLTYGLAAGLALPEACAIGARCGAATLCLPAPDVPSRATVLEGAPLRAA